ncbi:MAG: DUF2145 domain-containing protein [Burkholderiaceae bacterium]
MLAGAWGLADDSDAPRAAAQARLRNAGYEPGTVTLASRPWLWLAALIPWLHNDDHPAEWLDRATYRVSLPSSIEAFVQGPVAGGPPGGGVPHRAPDRRAPRLGTAAGQL